MRDLRDRLGAIVVYCAIGERRSAIASAGAGRARSIPRPSLESAGDGAPAVPRQPSRTSSSSPSGQLTYEDGTTKCIDVKITVRNRDGRDFVVTADEGHGRARTSDDSQLTGDVKLDGSDGFELTTDRATFNQDDSIVRAPGRCRSARAA